jgi:hypothetical protein
MCDLMRAPRIPHVLFVTLKDNEYCEQNEAPGTHEQADDADYVSNFTQHDTRCHEAHCGHNGTDDASDKKPFHDA